MTFAANQELLNLAIDDYSLFNKNQKNILKALIGLSLDGVVIASIKDLIEITGVTRATIASALAFLEENGIIETSEHRGIVFTGCKLKQSKLNEIITRYQNKQALLKK